MDKAWREPVIAVLGCQVCQFTSASSPILTEPSNCALHETRGKAPRAREGQRSAPSE